MKKITRREFMKKAVVSTALTFVISVGGRFGYKDQGQTANTQIAVYDFGQTQLVFEVRGLKTDKYYDQGIGNTFHFEDGTVAGGKFYRNGSKDPESLAKVTSDRVSRGGSFSEFIRCMRSRKTDLFDWNLETAHYSSALCHLGNISYRLGEQVPFGNRARPFGDNRAANETFARMAEHLKDNGLDLEQTSYRVGQKLKFDPNSETFIDAPKADALLTRPLRPPFTVPEKVV